MKEMRLTVPCGALHDLASVEAQLRGLMAQLSTAFAAKAFHVKAYREKDWQAFRTLSWKAALEIYARFSAYFEIYMPVLSQEGGPNEEGRLVWSALRQYGLRPCSDFFEQITENDIVEFYDPSGVQIFHNINFFDVCNYSFYEIFTLDFIELWERDSSIVEEIRKVAAQGFGGQYQNTVDSSIPEHLLVERSSEARSVIRLKFRKYSPLYGKKGDIAAMAIISTGKIVGRKDISDGTKPSDAPFQSPLSHLSLVD